MKITNRTVSTLFKIISGAIGIFVILTIASLTMMSYIFRERTETPIPDVEVKVRLSIRQPQFTPAELNILDIDSYSKKTSWDGTTHEIWIGCFPAKMEHKLRLKELIEIPDPDPAWNFPEVSLSKGRAPALRKLWTSGNTSSIGEDIVLWPVQNGFLIKYTYTEIKP